MFLNALISSLIVITAGSLLHFSYAWSGKNRFVAIFAAVNESTWEHIKIAIFPTLVLFAFSPIIPSFNFNFETFLPAAALCLITLIAGILILFYAELAILKKSSIPRDIGIFCIAVFLSQLAFFGVSSLDFSSPTWLNLLSCVAILIISALSFLCTFFPPKNFLFRDPRNKKYGLKAYQKMHHHHHH